MPTRAVRLDASDPWIRWDWLQNHLDLIAGYLAAHVELTVIAVGIGLAISLPLGVAGWRWRPVRTAALGVSGVVYTIPSLALFGALVPLTGLTLLTAEIGLVGYTLLILIRNIVIGLEGVPPEVRESARGMGYRPLRMLLRIELPLALPVIVAGIRIATVTTIGLITVTAVIGQDSLGKLILQGLVQDFKTPLVVGTALSIALAVAADVGLATAQRALTPWSRRAA